MLSDGSPGARNVRSLLDDNDFVDSVVAAFLEHKEARETLAKRFSHTLEDLIGEESPTGESAVDLEITLPRPRSEAAETPAGHDAGQRSLRRYEELVDGLQAVLWEADATLRLTYVSQGAEPLLGYPAERWVATKNFLLEHAHERDRREVLGNLQRVISTGGPGQFAYRAVSKDGRELWLCNYVHRVADSGETDPREKVSRLGGLIVDITSQKRGEEKLESALHLLQEELAAKAAREQTPARSVRRFGELTDAMPTAIALALNERIVHANPTLCNLTGHASKDELLGSPVTSLVHPKERERLAEHLRAAHDKASCGPSRFRIRKEDGSTIAGDTVSFAMDLGETGNGVGMIITAPPEPQHIPTRQPERVGLPAALVAHDLRNLFTRMAGYAELLLDRVEEQPWLYRDIFGMRELSNRAIDVAGQLLTPEREAPFEPVVLNVNGLLGKASKLIERLVGRDIELRTTFASGLGRVEADPVQIEQVMMELVINARAAMSQGGTLTIETANVTLDDDEAARHPGATPGRYVKLSVGDTGRGIDEKLQARIFDPFFAAANSGPGSGLGLSSARAIVERHHGHLVVNSRLGEGATFELLLPRIDAAESRQAEAARSLRKPLPRADEIILVVEDDESVRKILERALEGQGYRILTASGATGARALFERHRGQVSLLLTDVVLSDSGGPELYRELSEQESSLRILYISGYDDVKLRASGVLEHPSTLLRKPFGVDEIVRRVQRILAPKQITGEDTADPDS